MIVMTIEVGEDMFESTTYTFTWSCGKCDKVLKVFEAESSIRSVAYGEALLDTPVNSCCEDFAV